MFNPRYSLIILNSNIMKKISSMALLGLSLMGFSQVKIGVKANVLLNTSSSKWSEIKRSVLDYTDSGSKSAGFNVGLSARVNLPSTPLFIMPEIYYTSFNNSFTERRTKTTLKAKTNRIDVPVLVGVNLVSDNLGVFVGPVASYNLAKENTWNDSAIRWVQRRDCLTSSSMRDTKEASPKTKENLSATIFPKL